MSVVFRDYGGVDRSRHPGEDGARLRGLLSALGVDHKPRRARTSTGGCQARKLRHIYRDLSSTASTTPTRHLVHRLLLSEGPSANPTPSSKAIDPPQLDWGDGPRPGDPAAWVRRGPPQTPPIPNPPPHKCRFTRRFSGAPSRVTLSHHIPSLSRRQGRTNRKHSGGSHVLLFLAPARRRKLPFAGCLR